MTGLLSEELLANIGRRSEPHRELVTRRDIRKYAIATDNRQRKYLDGDQAPPMFHVEKAMAGGLEIEYHKPVCPGDWLTATRTLTDIYEKAGRSGPLIFYEVVMEIVNDEGELVIREKTTRILR